MRLLFLSLISSIYLPKQLTLMLKVPKRGILKQSTSFEQREASDKAGCAKEPHFDESNILATLHPADKVDISHSVGFFNPRLLAGLRVHED